jgi:hypothetical protein
MAAAKAQASSRGTLASLPPAGQEATEPLLNIPLATTERVAVTADTSGFSAGVNDAQATVLRMLKECRAITYSHAVGVYGSPSLLSVTYKHAPREPRTEVDDAVDAILGDRAPAIRSANVSSHVEDVSVFDADSLLYGYTGLQKAVAEIEVEYVV